MRKLEGKGGEAPITGLKIITSEKCLRYEFPSHPEAPWRISETQKFLSRKGFEFVEPPPACQEDILLVHTKKHFENVKSGNFFDPDTPFSEDVFEAASLSAGASLLASKIPFSFSLMRPPGHHATANRAMGFCYFNNIAIATKSLVLKNKKVAIVDFDCHHGNGTEEIFYGQKDVLYVSLHQSPGYPGTGLHSGENFFNFPLPPGCEGKKYLEFFDRALEKVVEFKPDVIAVSAGFDTYKKDPITSMNLDVEDFYRIGEKLKKTNIPLFSILEGGYSKDLPELIYSYISAFQ